VSHVHDFKLVDTLHKRYRCSCGVYGFRKGHRAVKPFSCQLVTGTRSERRTCGKPAVYVDGQSTSSRCAEHVEQKAA
jgi:hypothetical protein